MQASMWMIHDQIADLVAECHLSALSNRCLISGAVPYRAGTELSSARLYVVDTEGLPAGSSFSIPEARCFLLVCGNSFVPPQGSLCQYLVVKPGVSCADAMAAASEAFMRYAEWHDQLIGELLGKHDLNRLCEIGTAMLENPIMLYDRDYAVIGNSLFPDYAEYMWMMEKTSSYYLTRPEIVHQLKGLPEFQHTFETHGAELFEAVYPINVDPRSDRPSLYVNFGLGSVYEGRVVVPLAGRDVRPGDYQVAEIFTDVVRLALKQPSTQHDELDQVFRTYLVSLLEGRALDDRQLEDSLRLWHWPRRGRFLRMRMSLNAEDIETSADVFVCSKIELELPGACAIRYHDGVTCVICLADSQQSDAVAELLEKCFGDFARCIGIGQVYEDVIDTEDYYTEARIAAVLGMRDDPGTWCHRFSDHAMRHYHEHGTSVLPAIYFCDPDVRALMAYRGTRKDYYHILETYLMHDMNLLHTSEALFVHRTTLFNYLKEIRGIIEADLDDPEQRLRLLLSFHIMRMSAQDAEDVENLEKTRTGD